MFAYQENQILKEDIRIKYVRIPESFRSREKMWGLHSSAGLKESPSDFFP
jgi:hypothetical protein